MLDAYLDYEQGKPKLPAGWELIATLDGLPGLGVPEAFGFVARRDVDLVVALRGTDSFPDLLADAEVDHCAPPFDAGKARCAVGPSKLYASIQPLIHEALGRDKTKPVRVVGHSLGGAVATLLALDLAPVREAPLSLYSFGSSRVGDWRFWRHFRRAQIEAWRVVNLWDAVPHWPPVWLGYRHVGRRKTVRLRGAHGPLEDHSMERYCEAVERLARKAGESAT